MNVNTTDDEPRQLDRVELDRIRLLVLAAQRDGSRRLSQSLRDVGLSPSQAELLGVLAVDGPLSLVGLGRRIVCESGTPSRTADLLVRRGLVARVQSARDRRYVELELTDEGRALLPHLVEAAVILDRFLTDRLNADELQTLAVLLTKLLADTEGLDAIELRCGSLEQA
ncbi:MAG: MarR family winged helix-turn-helix transcriptional regulator [Nocardioides sp.]